MKQYIYWRGLTDEQLVEELRKASDLHSSQPSRYDADDRWMVLMEATARILERLDELEKKGG